jgi:hypothetical protein
MFRTAGLLMVAGAALAWGAGPRFARLGEFEGSVEVRSGPSAGWTGAVRNLPLAGGFQIRTGPAARVEVELDDGCVLRLGGSSSAEIADYVRLSTGHGITLISLDQGLAYFTGEPGAKDAVSLAAPGLQAVVNGGTRIRLEAAPGSGQVAVFEGSIRLLTRSAELDLRERQTARANVGEAGRFQLYREVAQIDLDGWSDQRDRLMASAYSAGHAPGVRGGIADLDGTGTWIESAELGSVWKPAAPAGWAPFRNGKWVWRDGPGYTWVSREAWGWAPYHYGRWARLDPLGWVWAPGESAVFTPGEVYWMRGANLAGWGPLVAGERWDGASAPRAYLAANTTFARFTPDAGEINPEGFTGQPKDPLAAARFAMALPSPPASRGQAEGPPRQAEVRFPPSERSEVAGAVTEAEPPAVVETPQPAAAEFRESPQPQIQPMIVIPGSQPQGTSAEPPVYFVISPSAGGGQHRDRGQPPRPKAPVTPAVPQAPPTPPAAKAIERVDRNDFRHVTQPPATPPTQAKPVEKPAPAAPDPKIPRPEQSGGRGKR